MFCSLAAAMPCLAQNNLDLPEPGNDAARGLAPATLSQKATTSAHLSLLSPMPASVVTGSVVAVKFSLSNVSLSPSGHRVQVVLDNRKSVVVHDTTTPVTFDAVQPGGHTLRLFVATGKGELLKETFTMIHFFVEAKSDDNIPEPGEPVLTVSSPRGAYKDQEADLIVFDYSVQGVQLSRTGNRLRYQLNGRPYYRWDQTPVYFPKLTPGTHRLVAEIVDIEGVAVPGRFARVEVPFDVVQSNTPAPVQPKISAEAPAEGQ